MGHDPQQVGGALIKVHTLHAGIVGQQHIAQGVDGFLALFPGDLANGLVDVLGSLGGADDKSAVKAGRIDGAFKLVRFVEDGMQNLLPDFGLFQPLQQDRNAAYQIFGRDLAGQRCRACGIGILSAQTVTPRALASSISFSSMADAPSLCLPMTFR